LGFVRCKRDSCVFVNPHVSVYLCLWVDDVLIAAPTQALIQSTVLSLSSAFDLEFRGCPSEFVGLQVIHSPAGIYVSQSGYIQSLLELFGMENASQSPVPRPLGLSLLPRAPTEPVCPGDYAQLVGSLVWIAKSSRPDIAASVSYLGSFLACAGLSHWKAALQVLRYLSGSRDLGLFFRRGASIVPVGFADSSFAPDAALQRRSVTGFIYLVAGGPVVWKSCRQTCVARSTCESELVALSHAATDAVYLSDMLKDLQVLRKPPPIILHEDNAPVIKIVNAPFEEYYGGLSKHVDIHHFFTKSLVASRVIEVRYIPTADQVADALTKALTKEDFTRLRSLMGIVNVPLLKGSGGV